jgi:molybdenum cofactor guanylyltransferase
MLGLILCGGTSTRMGRDKGLIPDGAQTWAAKAASQLATLPISVFLSVNDSQLTQYAQVFPRGQLIPDDPSLSLKGPLAGLLTVHQRTPTQDLFVLACDLLHMNPALLQELYDRRHAHPDKQAYLYTSDGEPEPLCGIYTAAGLARIADLYRENRLPKHSMKYALDQLSVDSLPIPQGQLKSFENLNFPPANVS